MKCPSCSAKMTTSRENFRYDASGLGNVTLANVKVSRCPECGEYEVVIPAIEQLHAALAEALVRQRARLRSEEVRFLRKYLGLSGPDFARIMDAAPETVSRWETGRQQMSLMAERLLRLLVSTRQPIADYSLEQVATSGTEMSSKKAPRLRLELLHGAWHPEAA